MSFTLFLLHCTGGLCLRASHSAALVVPQPLGLDHRYEQRASFCLLVRMFFTPCTSDQWVSSTKTWRGLVKGVMQTWDVWVCFPQQAHNDHCNADVIRSSLLYSFSTSILQRGLLLDSAAPLVIVSSFKINPNNVLQLSSQ